MNWNEVWNLLKQDRLQQEPWYRLMFLSHEIGQVQRAFIYMTKYPEDYEAHLAEFKIELSDLVAMIHMLCKSLNMNYKEIEELGLKRLMNFVAKRLVHDK